MHSFIDNTVIDLSCAFLGMINILHGLGLRLLALGHHTPFMVMNRIRWIKPQINYHFTEIERETLSSMTFSTRKLILKPFFFRDAKLVGKRGQLPSPAF